MKYCFLYNICFAKEYVYPIDFETVSLRKTFDTRDLDFDIEKKSGVIIALYKICISNEDTH